MGSGPVSSCSVIHMVLPARVRNGGRVEGNKINVLRLETVGFQILSLRHLPLSKFSLPENRAAKIPSICGLLCE